MIDSAALRFSSLPTEIVLLIFSLLDPPSLARCQQICSHWHHLANEEKVWRQIAIQRAYTQDSSLNIDSVLKPLSQLEVLSPSSGHLLLQTLSEESQENIRRRHQDTAHREADVHLSNPIAKADSTGYFAGISSFQDLCKRKWCLDREWQVGSPIYERRTRLKPALRSFDAAPPYVGPGWDGNDDGLEEVGRDVWRIKIDPVEKVMISTGRRGGVRVVDIQTGKVLWRLDRRMTRHFPHLEYDRGLICFDRIGFGNEIWKQSPSDSQSGSSPGSFELLTTLSSPHPTRAFRFQWPILAVATRDGFVLLWDVATQKIMQEISLTGSLHVEGNINYLDFDDDFVFLVGTGAKCFSVISRKLGKVIWTLADHFEHELESPLTFTIQSSDTEQESTGYASLERRKLKRASPSPWQLASGRQNFAQLMMAPIQSWSAVHPDHRSRTLVVLGQSNVLIIRDYQTCFTAWQQKREEELKGEANSVDDNSLSPGLFADLRFDDEWQGDADFSWDNIPPSQLAIADSRAMCIVGKPMLIDLDPLRLSRSDVREIGVPRKSPDHQIGDFVSDEEAGFAVYDSDTLSHDDHIAGEAATVSLVSCSCCMMDSTSIYAVQLHEIWRTTTQSTRNLAVSEHHDVLIWDFSKTAKQRW